MLDWLIGIAGHLAGLSGAQIARIERALPATSRLIALANDPKTRQLLDEAQALYARAQPLIEEATQEWMTVGPALQIVVDALAKRVATGATRAQAVDHVRLTLAHHLEVPAP